MSKEEKRKKKVVALLLKMMSNEESNFQQSMGEPLIVLFPTSTPLAYVPCGGTLENGERGEDVDIVDGTTA
jgi:hypothetical protein